MIETIINAQTKTAAAGQPLKFVLAFILLRRWHEVPEGEMDSEGVAFLSLSHLTVTAPSSEGAKRANQSWFLFSTGIMRLATRAAITPITPLPGTNTRKQYSSTVPTPMALPR